MLDRIAAFLTGLPASRPGGKPDGDDPRIAAAALLVHVMDADGLRQQDEIDQLREALAGSYGISGDELASLIAAGEEADRGAVDLYSFTSVLKRHLDQAARLDFIRLLWEMVYADRVVHELEDNIVWRIAELIGVESRDRVAIRRQVAGNAD